MKKIATALALAGISGCGGSNFTAPDPSHNQSESISSDYMMTEVAKSPSNLIGERFWFYEVKNKKTGKTYLISYHNGYEAESQVKLDEWTDSK